MKFFILIFLFLTGTGIFAQPEYVDSLRNKLEKNSNDTLKLLQLALISKVYSETNPDSSYYYAEKGSILSRKLELHVELASALEAMGYALMNMGNYPRALQTILSGIEIAQDPQIEKRIVQRSLQFFQQLGYKSSVEPHSLRLFVLATLYLDLGLLYENLNNYQKELFYQYKARDLAEQINATELLRSMNIILARVYLSMNKPDSALIFAKVAYDMFMKGVNRDYLGSLLIIFGRIQLAKGDKQLAVDYFRRSLAASKEQKYVRGEVASNLWLSELNMQLGKKDSSLYFANSALVLAQQLNAPNLLLRSYKTLNTTYKSAGVKDSLIKYQELIIRMNDSLFNTKQAQQFQNIDFDEQLRRQEMETARRVYRNRLQTFGLSAGLILFLVVSLLLWRSARTRQKAYALIKQQKQETEIQKEKVEHTLEELKSTQAQLIQSEKMASLGELTAGIAHEIQNPLNFVNNFSEVNKELLTELKEEIEKGNLDKVKLIASSVVDNEEKITQHGKRADSIVKGMLQHSRSGSGQKELTDINLLVNEYLRLAYHGIRAKDKSFNATIKTDFDQGLSMINIIPQDIGRVIVNLVNNAFYAVNEKNKLNLPGYEPTVTVSTKQSNGRIELAVIDNGNGIPQKMLDKIFQPFFTTKPPGQGTGLGLSLSYDIVKAHGGEIQVKSGELERTEFVIQLPVV